jgi:hypothetical protein
MKGEGMKAEKRNAKFISQNAGLRGEGLGNRAIITRLNAGKLTVAFVTVFIIIETSFISRFWALCRREKTL